jgi:hypothetical protein
MEKKEIIKKSIFGEKLKIEKNFLLIFCKKKGKRVCENFLKKEEDIFGENEKSFKMKINLNLEKDENFLLKNVCIKICEKMEKEKISEKSISLNILRENEKKILLTKKLSMQNFKIYFQRKIEKKNNIFFSQNGINLKNLVNLLTLNFTRKKINFSDLETFSKFELFLILLIIKKKMKKKMNLKIDLNLDELKKNILFIFNSNDDENFSKKRNEEKNRFIFFFVIKKLKKLFLKKDNNHMYNNADENFLIHYFSEILQKKECDFEKIFSFKKFNMIQKINHKILKQIFQSKIFYHDFFHYVHNFFLQDYSHLIFKKLFKIFLVIEKMFFIHNCDFQKSLENIDKLNIHFPWNLSEVEDAMFHFDFIILKLSNCKVIF